MNANAKNETMTTAANAMWPMMPEPKTVTARAAYAWYVAEAVTAAGAGHAARARRAAKTAARFHAMTTAAYMPANAA